MKFGTDAFWRPAWEAYAAAVWLFMGGLTWIMGIYQGHGMRFLAFVAVVMLGIAALRFVQAIRHWNRQSLLVQHTRQHLVLEDIYRLVEPSAARRRKVIRRLITAPRRAFAYGIYGRTVNAFGAWLLEEVQSYRVKITPLGESGIRRGSNGHFEIARNVLHRYCARDRRIAIERFVLELVDRGFVQGETPSPRNPDGFYVMTARASEDLSRALYPDAPQSDQSRTAPSSGPLEATS